MAFSIGSHPRTSCHRSTANCPPSSQPAGFFAGLHATGIALVRKRRRIGLAGPRNQAEAVHTKTAPLKFAKEVVRWRPKACERENTQALQLSVERRLCVKSYEVPRHNARFEVQQLPIKRRRSIRE